MVLKLELLGKQSSMVPAWKADVVIATFLWSFFTNEGDILIGNSMSQPIWRLLGSFTCSSLMSCSLVLQVWWWLSWLLPGYGLSLISGLQWYFWTSILWSAWWNLAHYLSTKLVSSHQASDPRYGVQGVCERMGNVLGSEFLLDRHRFHPRNTNESSYQHLPSPSILLLACYSMKTLSFIYLSPTKG